MKGEKVPGAIKDGKLQLSFAKGKADNPIIQAIVVYNGGVEGTACVKQKQRKMSTW